jgi:Bacterial proteasome activator
MTTDSTGPDSTGPDSTGPDSTGPDSTDTEQPEMPGVAGQTDDGRVYVVTPQGMAVEGPPREEVEKGDEEQRSVTELVEEPAKVMRIGNMIRQLLAEVKSAPLDDASRQRLRAIYQTSIEELKGGLAPELAEELERLTLPFSDDVTPSDAELRIAQAQLVGWLEGLFHGIQTALFAQQMAARAQLEQMRRALPPGPTHVPPPEGRREGTGGMYL